MILSNDSASPVRTRLRGLRTLIAVLPVAACASGADTDRDDFQGEPLLEVTLTETDSSGVAVVTISGSVATLPEWSLFPMAITEISGAEAPFMMRIGEVAFWGEDRLLVEDRLSSEVRAFGPDGGVELLLAGAGDGPGEVRSVAQLSVTDGDTVYAFDTRSSRLSVFGPDGAFLTSTTIEPAFAGQGRLIRDAWALGSDRILVLGRTLGAWPPPPGVVHLVVPDGVLHVVAADGTERTPADRFPGDPYVVIDGPRTTLTPFWNRPFVSVSGDRVLRGLGLDYELVVLDADLRPQEVIRWDGWREPLTERMLETLRDSLLSTFSPARAEPETRARLGDGRLRAVGEERVAALVHPEALPEALPALYSALLDDLDRIWVAAFKPVTDMRDRSSGNTPLQWSQEDAWHVLDSDRRPIARLRLPPRTRLVAVRGDRVAVVTRDDIDLEHVRVFEIDREGVG